MKHLMPRQNLIDAVRENKFSIYAVDHADQAIELLTGMAADEADSEGFSRKTLPMAAYSYVCVSWPG